VKIIFSMLINPELDLGDRNVCWPTWRAKAFSTKTPVNGGSLGEHHELGLVSSRPSGIPYTAVALSRQQIEPILGHPGRLTGCALACRRPQLVDDLDHVVDQAPELFSWLVMNDFADDCPLPAGTAARQPKACSSFGFGETLWMMALRCARKRPALLSILRMFFRERHI
jgi:hypothetical protein